MLQLVPHGRLSLVQRRVRSLRFRRLVPHRSLLLKLLELVSAVWVLSVMDKPPSATMA
jgi:hypothetical protein